MSLLLEKICGTAAARGMFPPGCGKAAVGVSGGADSVCLLHALCELRAELGVEPQVAHLNHGIRGAEADGDEEFVRELARELGLGFYSEKVDVPSLHVPGGPSIEQICRRERHAFFARAMDALGAGRVATAHTKSDQAETALMRVLRGTSLRGLGGMGYVTGDIVRPMLDATRDEALEFLSARGLPFREDSSNYDEGYFRNRVRLSLLPLLRERFNPQVDDRLFSLAELARTDSDYIESEADRVYMLAARAAEADGELSLSLAALSSLHDAVLSRVLTRAFYERAGADSFLTLTASHVREMMSAARGGRAGVSVSLPGGFVMTRGYDALVFGDGKVAGAAAGAGGHGGYSYTVKMPGEGERSRVEVPEAGMVVELWIEDSARDEMFINSDENMAFLNAEALAGELTIRNWRDGDWFVPLGMAGAKKAQDYFTDEKVPAGERRRAPLLMRGGDVAWVVGRRIDDRFKVARGGGRVLCLRVEVVPGG